MRHLGDKRICPADGQRHVVGYHELAVDMFPWSAPNTPATTPSRLEFEGREDGERDSQVLWPQGIGPSRKDSWQFSRPTTQHTKSRSGCLSGAEQTGERGLGGAGRRKTPSLSSLFDALRCCLEKVGSRASLSKMFQLATANRMLRCYGSVPVEKRRA